jgi:excisionase family DNA binding protein
MRKKKDIPHSSTEKYLTTGEAAKLCSVTPDTVLKWVRAGKVSAQKTPGGHNRIPVSALTTLNTRSPLSREQRLGDPPYQFCWEFHTAAGMIPDGCQKCVVYRSRSRRCYEMTSLPADAGYVGLYCKGNCEVCEYFKMVRGQRPNVLVITDRASLRESLQESSAEADFNLKVADCEYRCSMLVERFRPDYVVIDCAIGAERSGEFARLLYEDSRIPFVRIVLAGQRMDLPKECDRMVYALIGRNFTIATLSQLIRGSPPHLKDASGA